jgi:hypothetical protein
MIATMVLLGRVGRGRADFIKNGGFETGDFTDWTLSASAFFTGVVVDPGTAHSGNAAAFSTLLAHPHLVSRLD